MICNRSVVSHSETIQPNAQGPMQPSVGNKPPQ